MTRRIIAMLERSAGNETVGQMWTETKSFPEDASLTEVMEWARATSRFDDYQVETLRDRLTLNYDQATPPGGQS